MKSIVSKLTPDQISKFWDIIGYAIEQSVPPFSYEHPDRMNRLLAAALCGKIEVWAGYTREDDKVKFNCICVTQFLYDEPTDTKSLLIYALYGYSVTNSSGWRQMFSAMARYAQAKGCKRIIAYSKVDLVIKLAEKLGADTDYTFISFNLDEIIDPGNDSNFV
jgi:hypothetical protein